MNGLWPSAAMLAPEKCRMAIAKGVSRAPISVSPLSRPCSRHLLLGVLSHRRGEAVQFRRMLRRGSSALIRAFAYAPARHYAAASRPCRLNGPRETCSTRTRTDRTESCWSRSLSGLNAAGYCDGVRAPATPVFYQRRLDLRPSDSAESAQFSNPCCPHPGYRREPYCRASPRQLT